MRARLGVIAGLSLTLAACGGGGGGSGASSSSTSTSIGSCTLSARESWAAGVLNEWYLYPETLPASLDPAPYASVSDYIDALTATARSQGRDRYFTYLTSISSEDAYYNSGASAGFGIRLSTDSVAKRVFVTEAFEGTPALAAGIDRGAEILAIGTSSADLRTVSDIITASGANGVTDALGPSTAGLSRLLRIKDASGTRDITVTKATYDLTPVSARYGSSIITDGGNKVGYLNLRTFISTADPALRTAFANFRAQGVTNVIVDLRYNGGGLVEIAQLLGNLLGGNRSRADVFNYMTYRPEKASQNQTTTFSAQPQSIAATKIAFIGTSGTASASELAIVAFVPYLHGNAALIGTNTYGKPVGQVAIDRSACDDRLRVIAFALENSAHQGAYYNGLANTVEASCQATDDLAHAMGDPAESSTRQALDFLAGRSCTAIPTGQTSQAATGTGKRELLMPTRPDTAQREVPGSF